MDPSLDDFINYDNNNTDPLRTDFPDFCFGLGSPEMNDSDLFRNVPSYLPRTIQNILDQDTNTNENNLFFNFGDLVPTNTHFVENEKSQTSTLFDNFTPVEHTESSCSPNTHDDNESNLNPGSKKITKREKAKLKAKAKQEALNQLLGSIDKKYIPKEFYDENVDDETKKKMIQVIRNRVSAQSSRDKKKYYVQHLEEAQNELMVKNGELQRQNDILAQQLANSEEQCRSLTEQLEALKRRDNSVCLQCGPSSDFNASTQEGTEDNISSGLSNESSPLLYRTAGRRGNLFGFGAAFTTIMCFLLFLGNSNDGQETKTYLYSKNSPIAKYYGSEKQVCQKSEGPANENVQYRDVEFGSENFRANFPLLDRLKPLVDSFDAFHKELYKNYEQNQVVVDLSNRKFEHVPNKITNSNTKKTNFLGKNTTKNIEVNHTSTLLISSGVEVQKNESNKPLDTSNMKIQEEVVDDNGMLQKDSHLGVDKADFIQLFIPRHTLGNIDGAQNILNNNKLPLIEEGTEGTEGSANNLIEVWAKIFAVRDIGSI